MIVTTSKHDCMQFILNKSSFTLFKTYTCIYPLVFLSCECKINLLLTTKKVTMYCTFHHLREAINVGWPHGFTLEVVYTLTVVCWLRFQVWLQFFKRYYQSKDIQAFACNCTTSTFLIILNFGFGSLN